MIQTNNALYWHGMGLLKCQSHRSNPWVLGMDMGMDLENEEQRKQNERMDTKTPLTPLDKRLVITCNDKPDRATSNFQNVQEGK